MMSKKRTFQIDRRIIYLAIFIGVAVPLARPIGFPLTIDSKTVDAYNQIMAVPANGRVMIVLSIAGSYFGEHEAQSVDLLRHLFQRPVQIFFTYFFYAEAGTLLHETVMPQVDTRGKIYGKDWIDLGFVPGREAAMASLVNNIRGLISVDYYGSSLDQYDIMKGVNKIEDFNMIINIGGGDTDLVLRQWVTPTKVPFVIAIGAMSVPTMLTYYYPGGVVGMLGGIRGAAEYELIDKIPGAGLSQMDAMSMGHIITIFFILLGNVVLLYQRGRGEK